MNENIKNLEKVLEKYHFAEPVSPEEKARVIANQKKSLQATMRRLGRYSPLYAAVLAVFFLARRLGMGLSMLQSALVLGIFTAAAVSSLSIGGYLVYRSVWVPPLRPEHALEMKEGNIIVQDIKTALPGESPAPLRAFTRTISFEPLQAVGVAPALAARINDALLRHLKRLRGDGNILSASKGGAMLHGEVTISRGKYALYVRLVEPDGGIIYSGSYEASGPEGLLAQCGRAARDLSDRVE